MSLACDTSTGNATKMQSGMRARVRHAAQVWDQFLCRGMKLGSRVRRLLQTTLAVFTRARMCKVCWFRSSKAKRCAEMRDLIAISCAGLKASRIGAAHSPPLNTHDADMLASILGPALRKKRKKLPAVPVSTALKFGALVFGLHAVAWGPSRTFIYHPSQRRAKRPALLKYA